MTYQEPSAVSETSASYQLFMLFLCVYAISALAVQALAPLTPEASRIVDYVDVGVCVLFFADFLRTMYRAENRLRYFLTWGWIDLLSSIPMIDALRIGRVARMIRILRVLRALRATKMLVTHVVATRAQSAFYSVLAVSFSLVVFSSIAVLTFEQGAAGSNITSGEDALWWAMVTITTVGYGDRFPVSPEGRAVAAMLMTAGVGLFGTLSGVIAAWFLGPQQPAAPAEEKPEVSAELAELRATVAELRSITDSLRRDAVA
jgi:voltage-gated potassium channel